MFGVWTVITAFVLYMGGLFIIAQYVERKSMQGINLANNPYVYSLSLAVYCTTWTYYGSVGLAATSGMLFLTVYLGPTLAFIMGWTVLRKMTRIKASQRITSIADFISARYNRSPGLAAMVTVIALIGVAPYIALQLKAVITTFKMITTTQGSQVSWVGNHVGPIVVILMILFTNIFGVRRLDPTERHPGMVMAVAIESVVKLIGFLSAGIFVTYFLFDGFDDIFSRIVREGNTFQAPVEGSYFVTWTTFLILAMSAVICLPRQFHVTVIENFHERHIKTAMWLFPLYMLLINIFVFPIAMGGLLRGYSAGEADSFVLTLPLESGHTWLSLFVFIGGFSACTSMIMISSMTLSTMITNHLLLPVVDWFKALGGLRRHLLACRWVAVAVVVAMGYWFEATLGGSYMLVNMGLISFTAVLQFAPAIIGGIFWHGANKAGAVLGLMGGFAVWCYTMLLPSFMKSGWFSTLLDSGPWGIAYLRPEQLFGLTGLDPISHTVFWSLIFNIGLFVWGSLFFDQSRDEQRLAMEFVHAGGKAPGMKPFIPKGSRIDLTGKIRIIRKVLGQFFTRDKTDMLIGELLKQLHISDRTTISIPKLADLYAAVEKSLAGAIGAAAAHTAMGREELFSSEESEELSAVYGEILAGLNLTPEELKTKIDYYQDREKLLTIHAGELEQKVREREKEIARREQAEKEVRILNEDLEQRVSQRTAELAAVNKELEAFAYSVSHDLRAPLRSIDGFSQALLEDYLEILDDNGKDYLQRVRAASQRMAELIDHILKLSRLARVEIHPDQVNLSNLAFSIAEDLKNTDPARNVRFIIENGIIINGDKVLLRRVMENLLNNSWKYTSKKDQAVIEFGVTGRNGDPTYFVRDNGVGFDMEYVKKIFGIFQRLHGAKEFEGLGIGLATVQRILYRLGGRIWAEGVVDRGATFYFKLTNQLEGSEEAKRGVESEAGKRNGTDAMGKDQDERKTDFTGGGQSG